MNDRNTDSRRIAEESVGERPESAIPDAAKQNAGRAPEYLATSTGPQASLAAKTAEALGEREGGAYADGTIEEAQRRSRKAVRATKSSQAQVAHWFFNQVGRQPFVVISAFTLGYLASLVIHHRR
jgi:hypothetical protein